YDATFADYQSINIATVDATTTKRLLSETYETIGAILDATKASTALIQLYSDALTAQNQTPSSISATQTSDLAGYTSKLTSHSSSLFNDTAALTNDAQNLS